MNRRHFIGGLASALAGFTILPAATTYTRLWKAVRVTGPIMVPNPEYVDAPYEIRFVSDYRLIMTMNESHSEPFSWTYPYRFSELPPAGLEPGSKAYNWWAETHSICPFLVKHLT